MALYLDEVWLKDPSPERMKEFVGLIGSGAKDPTSVGAPQGDRFAGGPWFSNEEPKIIFLVDIPDHTLTFQAFGQIVSSGLGEKRRLTPVVEWGEVEKLSSSREGLRTGLSPESVARGAVGPTRERSERNPKSRRRTG